MVELRLHGKRALVTGGARGVGEASVLALAQAGADIVACYRSDEAAADRLRKSLDGICDRYAVVRADICDPAHVSGLVRTVESTLGGLDIMVNCVGAFGRAPFGSLEPEEWHRVLNSNLTGQYAVIRAMLPLLADHASVVNIGSGAAWRGVPMSAHYGAAKAALVGMGRSLSRELGARGIRVNTVEPGRFADPEGTRMPPVMAERMRQATPLGRLSTPADVAGAVLFFACAELSSFVTGAALPVDGGL
jgi:3-oxoacyl-[acyl-carrier protein] reductase